MTVHDCPPIHARPTCSHPCTRSQVLNDVFDRLKAAIDVVNAIEGYACMAANHPIANRH